MADRSGYIGRAPGDSSVIIARQTFEPTGIQTDFTFASGYTPGYIDVYLNGSRLIVASDYTATDGSVVGLTTNALNGDVLECVAYKAFNLGSVNSAAGNFTVGVDLTVDGTTQSSSKDTGAIICEGGVGIEKNLFVGGGAEVTGIASVGAAITMYGSSGIVSATSFYGDGSNITNAGSTLAAGSGAQRVVVTSLTTGTMTSAATDADLSWNSSTNTLAATNITGALTGDVTGNASGTAGGLTGSPNITINNLVGVAATFSGVVTYEDVTNVDSVGIITARSGIEFGAAGVGGTITSVGNAEFAGICTATSFKGDGSGLSGVGGDTDITSCLFI